MAKYSVGQRVRIKWAHKPANQHLVNMESHIVEVREHMTWIGMTSEGAGYKLAVVTPVGGWWMQEQLEPIIPDGAKPSEFKDVNELLDSLQLEEVVR